MKVSKGLCLYALRLTSRLTSTKAPCLIHSHLKTLNSSILWQKGAMFCTWHLRFHLLNLHSISYLRICLTNIIPNFLGCVKKHTGVADLQCHVIPQLGHHHWIFFIPCLEFRIFLTWSGTIQITQLTPSFQEGTNQLRLV